MRQRKARKRTLSLPESPPEEITGLDPTQEEIALQELEFGTDSSSSLTDSPCDATPAPGGSTAANIYTPFTHFKDDIDICSDFLVGQCFQGFLCQKHHTSWPYVWQLRYKGMGLWFTMDLGAQLVLERLYSDPAMAQVTGTHLGSNILIDLSTMTVHNSLSFDLVRRLSTSTCPTKEFHTVYIYYYEEEENQWKEYNQDFVKCIEEGLRERREEVSCANYCVNYSLDLVNMVQTNLSTKTVRRMRRRPVFRSPVVMTQKLRALSLSRCPLNPSERPGSLPDEQRGYPKTWIITKPTSIYEKSHVTCSDSEYMYIYTYFHKTMAESKYVILEVFRIQNYFQWKKYSQKKEFMESQLQETKGGCLERYLFHGTKSNHTEAIFSQNFDPRVSGKNGTIYGKGCYFARDASYSHSYSHATPDGHHFMFLAKVLVGRTALGRATYTRPPPLNEECPSSLLFDSCVDRAKDPTIFIIFDNDQVYPYFIIKYQKLHNLVLLD